MRVYNTQADQILLVRHDQIPILRFLHRPTAEKLVALFEFGQAEILQDQNEGFVGVRFKLGVHRENGAHIVIRNMTLEDRRILVGVEGNTQDADRVFRRLVTFLSELVGVTNNDYLQPVVVANESALVVQLSFSVDRLLSPSFLKFVQSEVVANAKPELADVTVRPYQLRFTVHYEHQSPILEEHRITFSRKEFVLEPRVGYPLSERVYASKAPVDTETHLRLLEELEATLTQE